MKRGLLGLCAALAAAGCGFVKVNGRPLTLGLPGESGAQSAPAQPPASSGGRKAPAPVDDNRAVQVISVAGTYTDVPQLFTLSGVAMDKYVSKVLGVDMDCGSETSAKPLAELELTRDMPASFTVTVTGGTDDGFVLRKDGLNWKVCTYSIGQRPTVTNLNPGWKAGRYAIYPVTRRTPRGGETFQIELYDPQTPAPWGTKAKKLSLAKKLDKPLFVDVTLQQARQVLREEHAGRGCRLPLPAEPDLVLSLERPIPGLVVRPLYTPAQLALRVQPPGKQYRAGNRWCSGFRREVVPTGYAPDWESPVELHLSGQEEGDYALSLGTAQADEAAKVTLMIFDASTRFDPLALVPPRGPLELPQRQLALHYPQLDTRELTYASREKAQLTAKLFATAPRELFVFPKADLDEEMAALRSAGIEKQSGLKKNEPLLLLSLGDRAEVVTADGVRYSLKASYIRPAPEGAIAIPSTPRRLLKDTAFGELMGMAPPSTKQLLAAHEAKVARYDACAEKAWEPYSRQLDGATWTLRDSRGGSVTVESSRASRIRDEGDAAISRACGSTEAQEREQERVRVQLLGEVERDRQKLLATARPQL